MSREQLEWQKADARVLGQILAAQNMVFALPNITRIAEFYAQILISIPGIVACRVCIGRVSAHAGEIENSVCGQGEIVHPTAEEDISFAPVDFKCNLADQPDIRFIAVNSLQHHFGCFVFKLGDADIFEVYDPFIRNLSNYIAVILENRWQKDLLEKANDELERKVEERTHDLTASRRMALDMMQEAVEARQRAEQANTILHSEMMRRERVEEALREQYSTLRSIIDSTDALIFSVDRQYRYTSFNRAHAVMMKTLYGAEIETGKSLLDYMSVAEDREGMKCHLDRVLMGEQLVEEAYSGKEPHSRLYFQVSYGPIKTETGDIIGMAVLAQDLTERKRAEEALRESEEKYRSLIQKVQTAIILHDGQGNILASNPLAQYLLGLSEDQLLTRTLHESSWHFLREDSSVMPLSEYPVNLVLASRQPLRGYVAGIDHADSPTWVLVNAEPEFNDTGEIVRIIVSFIDITEKKHAEESLRKLWRAVEQSPVSIIITDTTGAIEYVNPRFTELTGYTFEEVRGQNPRILRSGKTPPERVETLWKTIQSGSMWQGELCNKKKNGELYWEWAFISPVIDQTGVITNFVATKENITERKKTEQELEQYREHLEELVEQRTLELQEAYEQLQVLSRVKDEFVSNVSHELRTPITNLKLREYLIRSHPDQLATHLQVIERETDRLSQIIENLLQLSRMDQGRVAFSLAPVDLNVPIGQYVLDRISLAEAKHISLSFRGEPDLPKVTADANLIGQALSVLLTNALNYTPAGGQVIVQTHANPFTQSVGFSVIDTGSGIPPDEQPKLFTRFFRGQTGHKSGVPGTGLGLAIAKAIVEQHSGKIEVKSDGIPGRGTTFTVWLPTELAFAAS